MAAQAVRAWPRRNDVPPGLWTDLLREAAHQVDVLAFAGLFLTEDHGGWLPLLRDRAAAGARIRLLLGDPNGPQLAAGTGKPGLAKASAAGSQRC